MATTRVGFGDHHRSVAAEALDVMSELVIRVTVRVAEALDTASPVIIHGPIGTGKTFAVARACENLLEHHDDLTVSYVRLPASDRGRGLYAAILTSVTGEVPSGAQTEMMLRRELERLLAEEPRVLVIDEAHRLSRHALNAVQNLIDASGVQAAWVLIGNTKLTKVQMGALWSRATARIEVQPMSDVEAAQVASAMHPLFANTDQALLRRWNRVWAKGELRQWALLLGRALQYREQLGDHLDADSFAVLSDDL